MTIGRPLGVAGMVLWLTACSSAPGPQQLAQDAVTAMGGQDSLDNIQTLTMRGSGTRWRLGQTLRAGDPEPPGAELANVAETIDLRNDRAAMDYQLKTATGFSQHRIEVLTKRGDQHVGIEKVAGRPDAVMSGAGLFSWGSQNSPEFLLRRNVVSVMRAAAGSTTGEVEDRTLDGKSYKFVTATLPSDERVGLYFDPDSKRLAAYEVIDTESMLGDVKAEYLLDDYRDVEGVSLPHTITIRKDGQPYSELQFTSITINDPAAEEVFAIPDAVSAEVDRALAAGGDYSPVTITKVADGLHLARAYSHNSMIVEFPNWLAVVEAPYTEAQIMTLDRVLREQFPNKPIQYAAITHHHFDHTGGVRAIAALGATILVEKGHEPVIRQILDAPHTNPPDALETKRRSQEKVGAIEVFEGKKVLSDGNQTLELYAITGSPHVDPKVVAYVPSARALFQSDLWTPGVGAPANPTSVHLLESIKQLNLRVDTHVGGHGGVGPGAELVKAASAVNTTN